MKIDKQFFITKILPILTTSLISAGIAILQNILTAYTTNMPSGTSVQFASGVGAVLGAFKFLK